MAPERVPMDLAVNGGEKIKLIILREPFAPRK
jgi:hypothetical protein